MVDSKALINLGDFAKPANTLIEKISDAIGGIFKPYQIRRVAQAEAEAAKIGAVGQIEITDLQKRAMARLFVEEAKKQNNIESITSRALPEVSEEAKPELVEDDWITNFFDKCRLISDDDMQTLWAQILSGEANTPGHYSKRTVNLLASLDKADAELFAKLCSFGIDLDEFAPLIYETDHSIYNNHGINFMTLSHLDSLGLIHFDHFAGYVRTGLQQKGYILYFEEKIWVELEKQHDNNFKLGSVLLTQPGQQLATICGAQPRIGFVDYVKEKWRDFGYNLKPEAEQSPEGEVLNASPEE
ncbi:DUF2806 domain-containing protein [Candidatus Neomarinimicrobiota bacterium]